MDSNKFSSVAEVFRRRLNTPLIWGVLLLTLALTILFYFSQKQQAEIYSRYISTLSDYKFFETRVMRKMERVRVSSGEDTSSLLAALMSLRETAVSVYAASETDRRMNWMPPSGDFTAFENSVLAWVASVRRYMPRRAAWLRNAESLAGDLNSWNVSTSMPLILVLDSARMGFPVVSDSSRIAGLPESLGSRYAALLSENLDLAALWNRIDDDAALIRCENLLQAFKMKSLEDRELKFWIQQVFYLISIVLLLFTLFFVIRARK